MTKFNVGDKVRILNVTEIEDAFQNGFKTNGIYKVDLIDEEGCPIINNEMHELCFYKHELKYIENITNRPSKKQRITALENEVAELRPLKQEVAELKLIVHELRGKKTIKPSTTNIVEDIIEFEGKQYHKVDREAREGDYVSVSFENGKCFKPNKLYGPAFFEDKRLRVKADPSSGGEYEITSVYHDLYGRTLETVNVYELIKDGLNPKIPIVDETIEPLTPNQQRAAIIDKAKKFVEENLKLLISYDFVVINNGTKLYSRQRYQDIQLTTAKCNPSDVFNEHIGKAIALGRALGLDVSEFEQAVQPTEFVVGQKVFYKSEHGESFSGIRTISGFNSANLPLSEERGGYMDHRKLTILNDTNAIYGG